jgi:hypothetical protein
VTLPTSIPQNNEDESDAAMDSPLSEASSQRNSDSGPDAEPMP